MPARSATLAGIRNSRKHHRTKAGTARVHVDRQISATMAIPFAIVDHTMDLLLGGTIGRVGKARLGIRKGECYAASVRIDFFQKTVVPAIKNGKVKRSNRFHLSDDTEKRMHWAGNQRTQRISGFDGEEVTMASLIALMKGSRPSPHYS